MPSARALRRSAREREVQHLRTADQGYRVPARTSVGNSIDLFAEGEDAEGDELRFWWMANGGEIPDEDTPSTIFICTEAGDYEIKVTVSDDDWTQCEDSWTVPVTCVSDGGTGGGGAGGDGGMGGGAGGAGGMGGAGGAPECVDNSDCPQEGNSCTLNECTGGSCVEADAPIDTACDDDGVCDGEGMCVECNDSTQCPEDGSQCTMASCEANQCGQASAPDGIVCDYLDGMNNGVCEAGTCVAAPDCTTSEQCDDSNTCTVNSCVDGTCQAMPEEDGAACDVEGNPGTCEMGVCEGLCDNVDCSDGNDCTTDGVCDPLDGTCGGGGNEPVDTSCDDDRVCDGQGNCVECATDERCDDGDECTIDRCVDGACQSVRKVIDFESIDGAPPTEGDEISDQFVDEFGISFSLEDGTFPRIAQVGNPATAFSPADTPQSGQGVGMFFLTDDGVLTFDLDTSPLLVAFQTPTSAASGQVLDIDGGEMFTIEARDASDVVVETIVIQAGDDGTGDALATFWSFERPQADIYSIRFVGVRTQSGGFGLGFDNFAPTSPNSEGCDLP